MKQFRHTAFFLLTALIVNATPVCSFSQETGTRSVLILNSYHEDFEWTASQVSAAKAFLRSTFEEVEILVEYMDTKRIYNNEYLEALFQMFQLKYPQIDLDAVITTDDNALWFALQHRKALFRDSPILFSGINNYDPELISRHSRVTGVVEALDIRPTIDLILTLHPKTLRMAVVVDSTPTGIGQLKDIRAAAQHYPDIAFTYLEGKDLSHEDLFEVLRSLPADTVVLLAVWLRDKNQVFLPADKGGNLIATHAAVPVYGVIDMYLGTGIVGGKLVNSAAHGKAAAQKAEAMMENPALESLPVDWTSINPYMFDFTQLKRWDISVASLPEDSIIINQPVSFYNRYKTLIYSVLGLIVFLIATIGYLTVNIYRRKKAELLLISSERKWRDVLVNTPQIGVSLDRRATIVFANPSLLKLTGWTEAEVMGKNWFDMFISESSRKKDRHVFETIMAQKDMAALSSFENEIITRSGEQRNIAWSNVFTLDSSGEVEDVTCLGIDLTERKNWEKALQESEAAYRAIMVSMDDAVVITSPEYRIEYMNPAMIQKIGRDATGEVCHQAIHGRDVRCSWCRYEQVREGHLIKTKFDQFDDDRVYYVSDSPLYHADRSVSKLSVYRDITDIKQLEVRMQQAQKMETIGSLAGGIAHDFNNILSPIVGLSEMMLDDFPSDTPEYHNLHEIYTAGTRGRELVQQILSFSRHSEHQLIAVHIQKVLKEVLKLCRVTIPADISITPDIQTDCGPVMADPTQIHQIVMNFITNAYHAVESTGGTITVQLQETDFIYEDDSDVHVASGRYAVLSVTDTGTGIDPAVMNKIFDPYFTTKKKGKGTGLGLATVYGIVKAHGGDIKVHSEVGKGSCFHVYLPLLEKAQDAEPEKEMTPLPTGTEHILLVDDEKPIVHLEQQILERLGYRVTSFTSSVDALAAFTTDPSRFDLIITDMNMPNLNGMQLAEQLTAIRSDIPVIICTGFSERINKENAAAKGIKGLLMKPLVMKNLAHKVREVLDTMKE